MLVNQWATARVNAANSVLISILVEDIDDIIRCTSHWFFPGKRDNLLVVYTHYSASTAWLHINVRCAAIAAHSAAEGLCAEANEILDN